MYVIQRAGKNCRTLYSMGPEELTFNINYLLEYSGTGMLTRIRRDFSRCKAPVKCKKTFYKELPAKKVRLPVHKNCISYYNIKRLSSLQK
jgi:hypothetical protein